MADAIQITDHDRVRVITLARPGKKNALTPAMLTQLEQALATADEDGAVAGVVLTGAGDAFSAGVDLAAMQDWTAADAEKHSETAANVMDRLESSGLISAAAITGPCLGGGHELALACDLRFAAEDAVFGQPEVKIGLIPGFGATARLPRLVGQAAATELVLTGKHVDASAAAEIGLVNGVVEGPVEHAVNRLSTLIDATSAPARTAAKQLLQGSLGRSHTEAVTAEREAFTDLFGTPDMNEGIDAFLDGRDPKFEGDAG